MAVQATVNGHTCQTVAEPDGEPGHWVRIDAKQQRAAAPGVSSIGAPHARQNRAISGSPAHMQRTPPSQQPRTPVPAKPRIFVAGHPPCTGSVPVRLLA